MSYEEGETFENCDISFYEKTKIIYILKLYIRSAITCDQFIHADLHNGNWKIKKHKNKNLYQIVFV